MPGGLRLCAFSRITRRPQNVLLSVVFVPDSYVLNKKQFYLRDHRMETHSRHGGDSSRSISPVSRTRSARSSDVHDQAQDDTPQPERHLIGRFDWEQHESPAEHPNSQEHLWSGVKTSRTPDRLGEYYSTNNSKDDISPPKPGKYIVNSFAHNCWSKPLFSSASRSPRMVPFTLGVPRSTLHSSQTSMVPLSLDLGRTGSLVCWRLIRRGHHHSRCIRRVNPIKMAGRYLDQHNRFDHIDRRHVHSDESPWWRCWPVQVDLIPKEIPTTHSLRASGFS